MTEQEWVQDVEAASGMSRQQFEVLGLTVRELTCRRLECKGWHFVRDTVSPSEGDPGGLGSVEHLRLPSG
jgi:hypothetical protein